MMRPSSTTCCAARCRVKNPPFVLTRTEPIEVFLRDVHHGHVHQLDAGVGDDDVDVAELFERRAEQAIDLGQPGDVCLHGDGGATGLLDGCNCVARALLIGRVVHDHLGTERCVALGNRSPDPASRAGDESDLVLAEIAAAQRAGKVNASIPAVDLFAMVLGLTDSWLSAPPALQTVSGDAPGARRLAEHRNSAHRGCSAHHGPRRVAVGSVRPPPCTHAE